MVPFAYDDGIVAFYGAKLKDNSGIRCMVANFCCVERCFAIQVDCYVVSEVDFEPCLEK